MKSGSGAAGTQPYDRIWLTSRVGGGLVGFLAFDAVVKASMSVTGLDAYLPPQIGCMVGAFSCLAAASIVAPGPVSSLHAALGPAVSWVGRWLTVFLVPVQVMLPTICFPGGATEALKLGLLLSGGWLASVVFASRIAQLGQMLMPSSNIASSLSTPATALKPLTLRVPLFWLFVAGAALAFGHRDAGRQSGDSETETDHAAQYARMLGFAALGVGAFGLPVQQGVPGHWAFLGCGAALIAGMAANAYLRGESFEELVRRDYLTGDKSRPLLERGAGDILLWFLGPSLVATGVQIYQYRARVAAYFPVLLGTCGVVSLANILATGSLGCLLGISPDIILGSTVRCHDADGCAHL